MTMSEASQPMLWPETELPSTSSAGASRAKTLVELEIAPALAASDPASGGSSPVSLASYDPDSQSWKTSQRCLMTGWTSFSGAFPRSGMMRSGRLYPRAPWVHHTCDSECSLWPTPTASMDGRGFGIPLNKKTGRYKQSTILRVHALVHEHGWRIHPRFTEALMDFPSAWTEIEPLAMRSTGRLRK